MVEFLRSVVHKVLDILPGVKTTLSGDCKSSCALLAMEEDIKKVNSFKLKLHLFVCQPCSNYYHQMAVINQTISKNLKLRFSQQMSTDEVQTEVDSIIEKYSAGT